VVVVADAMLPAPDVTVRAGGTTATIGETLRVARGNRMTVEVNAPPVYAGARAELRWNGEAVASDMVPTGGAVTFERFATLRGYLRLHLIRVEDGMPL